MGEDPVPVNPPGEDVAVYVTDSPPVAPAVYATVAVALPPVTAPIVGACGTVVAVTEDEEELSEDVPALFVAVTAYVYPVDDCKPVTIIGELVPLAVYEPGVDVTVKLAGTPPVSVTGENATDADPLLYALPVPTFVATTEVGTDGTTIFCNAYHPPF
jgi:hypothetical protein